MPRNFMASAVKRPGALRRKAKRAHVSTMEFARENRHSPGRTGKQARLALTFAKYRARKRKSSGRRRSRS